MNLESSFMWIFTLIKRSIQRGARHALGSGSTVATAKPKAKSSSKAGRGHASTKNLGNASGPGRKVLETKAEGTRVDEDDSDHEGQKKKKSKKARADPLVAEKLSRLQVEKELILTQEKWGGRVKILNQEVSESMASAEAYKQTSGFLGQICFSFLVIFLGVAESQNRLQCC